MAEAGEVGPAAMSAHGEFCWAEIATTDLEKCKRFYSNVFGWEFAQSKTTGEEMEYLEFSSAGETIADGALYEMTTEMFGGEIPPAHIALYISVDDVDASTVKARKLGGNLVFGPMDIPNVGRFSVITDPTGATISMITLDAGGQRK